MNDMILMYIKWIGENLDEIEGLRTEVEYWQTVYKKRAFDETWPSDIKEIIEGIKIGVKKNIEECQYYLKRIEEMKNDKISMSQSIENEANASEKIG